MVAAVDEFSEPRVRVASWNVNGLRSATKKGFLDWLDGSGAHVVGLQEVRALPSQLAGDVASPPGWQAAFNPAERLGYSGVATYSRLATEPADAALGDPEMDAEGRLQLLRVGALTIANVYFPNGSGKGRDNGRVPFKLAFYRRLFDRLEDARRAGEPVLVIGDFNTAHTEIDLARPRENSQTSGFLPNEREELDRWLRCGWTDTYRALHPNERRYTWWSNRPGVRERNVGWRIDYVLASPGAARFVEAAHVWDDVRGSDHCPVGVDLDAQILRAG